MNIERQIEYLESRIEDINILLKEADEGNEVGDTMKLEQDREILQNKINRLYSSLDSGIGKKEPNTSKVNSKIEEPRNDISILTNEIIKTEVKEQVKNESRISKEKKIILFILIFIWMTFVAICGVNFNRNRISDEEYCREVLRRDDFVGTGCSKYFEDESWYQEYLENEKVSYWN